MEANVLAARMFQDELESAAHHAGSDGAVHLNRRREHPAGVYRFFVLTQHLHHGGRQDDLSDGAFCLGGAELKLTAHIVDLLVYIQHAGLEIQVVPLQRHELAAAQPGSQVQKEEFIVALGLRLNEKPLQLLPREHLHLPCFLRRYLAADGRVHTDEPLLHRLLQRGAAGGVTHTYRPVGQPFAVLFGETLPTAFFDPPVKLLQVILRQLVERDVTDFRDDVQAYAILVCFLRSGAYLRFGVIFVPVFQPVPEEHLRTNLRGRLSAALLLELLKLFQTLFLSFGEDVFRFGIAVVIVADDDASLPASVLALPYSPVSGFAFSCHGFSSFPNKFSMKPPTTLLACFCISDVTWV